MAIVFDAPDMTVIGPDGKRLAAKYVGLDAVTGLSILRLDKQERSFRRVQSKMKPLNTGETVLLFGPEPVSEGRERCCVVVSTLAWVRLKVGY